MGDLCFRPTDRAGVNEPTRYARDTDGAALVLYARRCSRDRQADRRRARRRAARHHRPRDAQRADILLAAAIAACLGVVIVSIFIAAQRDRPDRTADRRDGRDRLGAARPPPALAARSDEIGRLAATFDAMLDRLQDAFARERQFITDASHELKTPLTVINANAQLIRRWGDRDPHVRADSLNAIIEESTRLAEMVDGDADPLESRLPAIRSRKNRLALEPVVSEVVANLTDRAAGKGLDAARRVQRRRPHDLRRRSADPPAADQSRR